MCKIKNTQCESRRVGVMLSDVEGEIGMTKRRLADLEQSEKILKQKILTGEPFPEALLQVQA
jgi:hypothetical protein